VQLIRVVGGARKDERIWEAFWSWRAHPPTVGEGSNRSVVEFSTFLAQLGLGEQVEAELPEISDEEIKVLFEQGRMGLFPPGM